MNDLRIAAQQALEALDAFSWEQVDAARIALRAALADTKGGGNLPPPLQGLTVAETATTQQPVEQTPPSEYRRGYWDGFAIGKREGRIEAEDALTEPVQEPVAWVLALPDGRLDRLSVVAYEDEAEEMLQRSIAGCTLVPLYTAPPQRKPLTDEEIDVATSPERDALLDHIYEYGTAAEGVIERIRKLARAIEAAHGIIDSEIQGDKA